MQNIVIFKLLLAMNVSELSFNMKVLLLLLVHSPLKVLLLLLVNYPLKVLLLLPPMLLLWDLPLLQVHELNYFIIVKCYNDHNFNDTNIIVASVPSQSPTIKSTIADGDVME